MTLTKVDIAPDNPITHEVFTAALPSRHYSNLLVMKFVGTYGVGSSGNGDARYMAAVTKAAIEFTEPWGIIYDFTQLSYVWGDMMDYVLSVGKGRWDEGDLPVAIVVSEKCEPAIRSLLQMEMDIQDLTLLHHSVTSAVEYVDQQNQLHKDAAK